ncbi:MAG: HD domain-containing protein [Acidimicrobiia bacterium]|nr:HD domain-containing protein [Acidimicrobiia bacterium]
MAPHADELVRRLAAGLRAAELYAPQHPLVQRSIQALASALSAALADASSLVIGFIGDDVVVNDARLGKGSASLTGFVRGLRDREIEKITFHRGVTPTEVQAFLIELAVKKGTQPLADRLAAADVRRIAIGRLSIEEAEPDQVGIEAAKRVYHTAVESAEALWDQARAGEQPDPETARKIIDSLANIVNQDRTSLMALTALKKYDNYTFTHMVNVAALSMAQARALNLDGPLLREFGFAALMHDIGKVHTPLEVLNKPGKLTTDEFTVMKQHVVDGAHILRRTPEMPALAPIVAFEHHLKQDLSGYPENIGHRKLNLCTMIVSIADVFDALRSNRPYREGLATTRIKSIMAEQGNPAFNQILLRRFVNLMGLFPIGTIVRLNTEEVGVVTAEHPDDPFRPQVKILYDATGEQLDAPYLANTWERDSRGAFPKAVVESVDPDGVELDPLTVL